ncbi:MAG: hypothetical protein ACXVFL_08240 [Solirubrobacteraceae bacterium]
MYGDDKLDWHADYAGGWHELFANAGDACVVDGVPLPFHGEASTARWDVVTHDDDALVLRVASRLPVVLERRMRLAGDRAALLLEETVTNVGTGPVEILWAHHPTFAARPGMRIDVPAGAVHADAGWRPTHLDVEAGAEGRWPQLGAADLSRIPDGRSEHLCFLPDLDGGWAALRDPGGSSVALAWDAAVWPHMWLWQQIGGEEFPWYGRPSIVALEPHRAWPADGLAAARERGQALTVPAGGRVEAWLTATLFDDGDRPVQGVSRDGAVRHAAG